MLTASTEEATSTTSKPYRAIIDTAASKGCDLIVMASHGRHGISAIILGSRRSKCSRIPRFLCWSIDELRRD
jgi:nucleotide-binding universal stress UspA family protein